MKSKKSKILGIAQELLGQKPIDEISIREIAGLASVNVASINYYFGSKEALFDEALGTLMMNGIEEWISNNIDYENISFSDLVNFVYFLHVSVIRHPSISKTRVIYQLNNSVPNRVNIAIYNEIYKLARYISTGVNEDHLKIQVSMIYSSLANYSCSVSDLCEFLELNLREDDSLHKYTSIVLQQIFKG